jgi:hypothetical protein
MTIEFKSWDEMTELEQAASDFSDFYKDVHGFRPRHYDFSSWTIVDFDREFALLSKASEREAAFEAEQQAQCAAAVEARISANIAIGAKDRETAIRWLHEAHETNGDSEYLCYLLGVKYGYFNK